jgi:RNA polymerase sigma factor (sigma-70 family)
MNIAMPVSQTPAADALATTLLANLGAFQSFARKRLHDDSMAADAVQESLLRALKAAPGLSHDTNLLAWFYRILRNVLTDLYRSRARESAKLDVFEAEFVDSDPETEVIACACLRGLLPALRPQYAEVIQRLDLDGEAPASAAESLGVSRNLLKVRHHRARQQLRSRLEETCRACATHGCLDCSCNATEAGK